MENNITNLPWAPRYCQLDTLTSFTKKGNENIQHFIYNRMPLMDLVTQGYSCQLEMPSLPQFESPFSFFFCKKKKSELFKTIEKLYPKLRKEENGNMYKFSSLLIFLAIYTCANYSEPIKLHKIML